MGEIDWLTVVVIPVIISALFLFFQSYFDTIRRKKEKEQDLRKELDAAARHEDGWY